MTAPELALQDCVVGRIYPCPPGKTLRVGRYNQDAPLPIPCDDPAVSRHHCDVQADAGGFLRVVDLGSTHGTFVNGQRLANEGTLRPGDQLQVGPRYRFQLVGGGAPAAPADPTFEEGRGARVAPPPATVPALVGGRYRVVRELAQGGVGIVYEAVDEQTGARCALKALKGGKASPAQVERFRREAELGRALGDHPGIVPVLASGALPSGELFCVLEFVEGAALDERLRAGLPRADAVRLVLEVCRAVAHAHARGVIHRDLKPQNVMVTPDDRARLTDFGIAKALDDAHGLTATGAIMGTPSYMPPEQVIDAKRVDERSDVYGLGAILYVAITGSPPIEARGVRLREVFKRIARGDIRPPSEHDPTIDPALDAICLRALAREPDDRWPSAADLGGALERWLAGDRTVPELAPAEADPEEGRGGLALRLLAVAALVIGAALVAWLGLRP